MLRGEYYRQRVTKHACHFSFSMVWREANDFYFCLVNIQGCNSENKNPIGFPSFPLVVMPFPQRENLPVPVPPVVLETLAEDDVESELDATTNDTADVVQPVFLKANLMV